MGDTRRWDALCSRLRTTGARLCCGFGIAAYPAISKRLACGRMYHYSFPDDTFLRSLSLGRGVINLREYATAWRAPPAVLSRPYMHRRMHRGRNASVARGGIDIRIRHFPQISRYLH